MITLSWYAWLALRRRVSMSAIGSVMVIGMSNPSRRGSRRAYGEDSVNIGPPACRYCGRWLQWTEPCSLPRGLGHAGKLAAVGHFPDAYAAQAELAVDGLRPPAPLATGVRAHRELRLRGGLDDQRLLRHVSSP